MDQVAQPSPRVVKKVAVGYDLNALPPGLIRCFTVLRRKLERAGYAIEVRLRPLPDVLMDVDVLFVAEELAEAVRQTLPGLEVKYLRLAAGHQPAFDELLHELDSGQKLGARPAAAKDGQPAGTSRIIMRYRGHDRLL